MENGPGQMDARSAIARGAFPGTAPPPFATGPGSVGAALKNAETASPFDQVAQQLEMELIELEGTIQQLGGRLVPVRNSAPAGENAKDSVGSGVAVIDRVLAATARIRRARGYLQMLIGELVI